MADHLEKKLVTNRGQLPKHFAEGTHQGIISQKTFDQATALRQANHRRNGGGYDAPKQYDFTRKIVCGHCGKHYRRKMNNGKPCWICGTYLTFGKDTCPSKYIPETVIQEQMELVIGCGAFSEEEFHQRIKQVHVPASNRLVFDFHDGSSVETEWVPRSRKESWTDEMREQARAHARKRYDHE